MEQTDIIFAVSTLSVWLGSSVVSAQGNVYSWDYKKGEIYLDIDNMELALVDCIMDDKTYWAIMGFFISKGIDVKDMFTEK